MAMAALIFTLSEYEVHGDNADPYLIAHELYEYDWPQGPGNLISKEVESSDQDSETINTVTTGESGQYIVNRTIYADQPLSIMDYTYDPDKPYHAVASITNTTGNGSSQSASHDFSYDASGNLEEGVDLKKPDRPATRRISYNADNMPVQINHSGKGDTRLYYDSTQIRAKKTASAGSTYYINKFFEVTPKGEVKYIFAANNRMAVIKPQGTFYIHADHLSSATVITDKDGKVVDQADYLPYGDQRKDEIDLIDYQFTDQEKRYVYRTVQL